MTFPENFHQNEQFNILLDNFEGPIDLLLHLAKTQKVDLSKISISELAKQYIIFINQYKNLNIEIAADYLVMASWLTYLKSKILLPKEEKNDDHSAEEIEEALRYQLERLEAFQKISKLLYSRPLINRDIFYGGLSKGLQIKYNMVYTSKLYDLLNSYSKILSNKEQIKNLTIEFSKLYSVDEAIKRFKQMFGDIIEWTNFINIIPKFLNKNKTINKSVLSSNFVASLELSKNGFLEVKQENAFGNIYVRVKNNEN